MLLFFICNKKINNIDQYYIFNGITIIYILISAAFRVFFSRVLYFPYFPYVNIYLMFPSLYIYFLDLNRKIFKLFQFLHVLQLKIRTWCILRLLVNNNFTQSSTRVRVNCSLHYR